MKPVVDRTLWRGVGTAFLIEGVLAALLAGFLCSGCASPTAPPPPRYALGCHPSPAGLWCPVTDSGFVVPTRDSTTPAPMLP